MADAETTLGRSWDYLQNRRADLTDMFPDHYIIVIENQVLVSEKTADALVSEAQKLGIVGKRLMDSATAFLSTAHPISEMKVTQAQEA